MTRWIRCSAGDAVPWSSIDDGRLGAIIAESPPRPSSVPASGFDEAVPPGGVPGEARREEILLLPVGGTYGLAVEEVEFGREPSLVVSDYDALASVRLPAHAGQVLERLGGGLANLGEEEGVSIEPVEPRGGHEPGEGGLHRVSHDQGVVLLGMPRCRPKIVPYPVNPLESPRGQEVSRPLVSHDQRPAAVRLPGHPSQV